MTSSNPPLRIGYSTLRDDLGQPGDRRRFCYYAAQRGIPFTIARPGQPYDVVISSLGGDLGIWKQLPRPTRLILDLVDSYLATARTDLKSMLRGAAKFALRHTRGLHLDYRALMIAACRRADAIVCATEEQREVLRQYCPNIHVILDFQPEAERRIKTDYASGEVFNLVWEGLPENLVTFRVIAGVLRDLRRGRKIALHLVTNLERARISTHVWMEPTRRLVQDILGGMEGAYLYQWNQEMMSAICTACDLGLIPIPLENRFFAGKPESKLVLLWRMGLPVVTSATPAYLRTMKAAGLEMTCRGAEDWSRLLERYMAGEEARRDAGRRGRAYALEAHGVDTLMRKWDAVLASVR